MKDMDADTRRVRAVRADTQTTLRSELGGRPPIQVWGTRGLAASMHPLASNAAAEILRMGGNAVDAAVALGAAISVTSPDWAGLAGDSAWLTYVAKTDRFHYLDGYSTCPATTSRDLIREHFGLDRQREARAFQEEPPEQRHTGVVTAMVPGTPAAWVELWTRFGTLPLDSLLQPAIRLAEEAFPVNAYFATALRNNASKLRRFESSQRVVCDPGGAIIEEGGRFRQPELADTIRRIADEGHDGFYDGATANMIVEHCRRQGAPITSSDLQRYRAVWRNAVAGTYRGNGIVVTAPPTAGIHVIQALNILEGFELRELVYHGAQSLHLLIEALKLALADRRAIGGDPDHRSMDVTALASKAHGAAQRSRIDADKAIAAPGATMSGDSTTHFCVIDAAGNIVSATQSIGSAFGCGEVITGTGMFMNDRTWWMSLDDGPNTVTPMRRANIGHAPTVLTRGERPFAALGSPGGFGIVQYVVQVVVNMLDYGLDLQQAIEAPRFRIEDLQGTVGMEQRIAVDTRSTLAAKGHHVIDYPAWTDRVGGVEGISIDPNSGSMLAGYDPRRNSLAVGVV